MAKTYVLTSNYYEDTDIIAAGNDINKLRQLLRKDARRVIREGDYDSPKRKALRKKRLEALKDPDIMEWNDGETEDLYSLSIIEVPLHDKKTKEEGEYVSESPEKKLINFLLVRQEGKILTTDPEKVFYENQDIQSEGISANIPGSEEEIEAISVSASRVTVTLIEYGESGDEHDDLTRNIPMAELDASVQQEILEFITEEFEKSNKE